MIGLIFEKFFDEREMENKQELIEYCESLKGGLNKFINEIDG